MADVVPGDEDDTGIEVDLALLIFAAIRSLTLS